MSSKDWSVHVEQMHYAARRASANVEGLTFEDFLVDLTHQEAALMNLFVVGEMAGRLARDHLEFSSEHPDLPIASMRGMRNRIAHGYHVLALDVVWQTLTQQIPELLVAPDRMLDNGETHGQS